jgi:developmental checkpoint coupling sporulation initiation to replication initiation
MSEEIKGNEEKGVWDMELLSDDLLVDSYVAAVQLHLEPDFIRLLSEEMERRQINPESCRIGA